MRWLSKIVSLACGPPAKNGQRRKPKRKRRFRRAAGTADRHPGRQQFGWGGTRLLGAMPRVRAGVPKGCVIAYHGTPSIENAQSIIRDGWMAGPGNALGDGIYFARDVATAKGYAGTQAVYLKCSVRLGRSCHWNSTLQSQFTAWCKRRNVNPDASAKTSFLLHKGYRTLVEGNVIVVLTPLYANPSAHKRRDNRIRVLGVYRAADDKRIRV